MLMLDEKGQREKWTYTYTSHHEVLAWARNLLEMKSHVLIPLPLILSLAPPGDWMISTTGTGMFL